MGKLKEIVIDADHPADLARFYAQIVEGYAVRPYDDAEIARLAALGITPETDPTVLVDGPGPSLTFIKRSGPRPFRNRVHIDLGSPERESEVARVMALGATFWRSEQNYTTLRDPEGNPFCIIDQAG
jgi:Glyoxalase-like domain